MTIAAVHSGGLVLTGQNLGTPGTNGDPWTLALTMTARGIVSLTEAETEQPLTSPPPPDLAIHGFATGDWFAVTILNDSGVAWTSFDIYPQEDPGIPSPPGDGLSFAELFPVVQWCSSDKYPSCIQGNDPYDNMHASGGSVANGESVTFLFPLTDNSPISPIYLEFVPNSETLPLEIACGNPPVAHVAVAYLHEFPTAGGVEPYVYTLSAGALPPGLTLNAATGALEGTPTLAGVYEFTITVTDADEDSNDAGCSIQVKRCLLVEV